jgi:hypothetical protein
MGARGPWRARLALGGRDEALGERWGYRAEDPRVYLCRQHQTTGRALHKRHVEVAGDARFVVRATLGLGRTDVAQTHWAVMPLA